jgi:hypothetical protein
VADPLPRAEHLATCCPTLCCCSEEYRLSSLVGGAVVRRRQAYRKNSSENFDCLLLEGLEDVVCPAAGRQLLVMA